MGLFDWVTGKARDEQRDRETLLQAAARSIGGSFPDFTARSVGREAGRLIMRLREANRVSRIDDGAIYVSGIFAIGVSRVMARMTANQSTEVAPLTLLMALQDDEETKRAWRTVGPAYDRMVDSKDKLIDAIDQNVAKWVVEPTDANLDRLGKLFELCLRNMTVTGADELCVDQLRKALATIGIERPRLDEPRGIGAGACAIGTAFRDFDDTVDMENENTQAYAGLFILTAAEVFSRITKVEFDAVALCGFIGLYGIDNASDRTLQAMLEYREARDSKSIETLARDIETWISDPSKKNFMNVVALCMAINDPADEQEA